MSEKKKLYQVRVENPAGEQTATYFVETETIEQAMDRACDAASDDWVQDDPRAVVVSAKEVNGKLLP